MKIKKILLTGDDGYKSSGIRLLINALKDKYDLTVAATYHQQSGVGGLISIGDGFDWGIDKVDGVKAFWVKGSPADAMALISQYYDENSFDLIISGVNWGANLGGSMFSSGTVNAALRGLGLEVATHAITMSWDLPPKYYLNHHAGDEDLADYLTYPGKEIDQILDLIIENKLWGAKLVNVNFPQKPSKNVLFTKPILQIKKIYSTDPAKIKELRKKKSGHFLYSVYSSKRNHEAIDGLDYDVAAINKGFISITPCAEDLLDEKAYVGVKGKKLKLN